MSLYRGLLKGLNLVQQKSWDEAELMKHFPEQAEHWRPLLAARHPHRPVASLKWRHLEELQTLLLDWHDPIEAGLLRRRLHKIAAYFQEVEKPRCDAESLKFFLQDLPLLQTTVFKRPTLKLASAPRLSAEEARVLLDEELKKLFPAHSVCTILSRGTLARASTTKDGIRLREDATFTPEELEMLTVHEAWVHLGTNLAGTLQAELPWLAQWHPGVTGFQEGLALIAEIITGHWHEEREAQVLLRHEAAHWALKGENARQVWSFLADHGLDKVAALEVTLRVFRGCSLEGGMAFGKEFQYLLGLHQWLVRRSVLTEHDMRLALSGKMDFLEWEVLRGTPLGDKMKLSSPPSLLLRWMDDQQWPDLQQRLGLKAG